MKLVKKTIKKLLLFVANQHASLHQMHYWLGANYKHKSIALGQKIGLYGILLRQAWYKKTLKNCGRNFIVGFGSYVVYPNTEIGHNCAIEEYCIVSHCKMGDDVILAANVSIMSGAHHHPIDNLDLKFRENVNPLGHVILGNNLWIGTHAVIMADIDEGAIVAAGAVVTKKVAENAIVAGCPAKHIRFRGSS